jgi:hypothetical protein
MTRVAERDELRQSGLAQVDDSAQEPWNQLLALPFAFVLLQQQITEPLFEAVDQFQGWSLGQIGHEADLLLGFEVMAMPAHQGKEAAVLGPQRIDLPPAGQEVVIHQADHVETISHDDGIREVFSYQTTVDSSQIHADDTHLLFAWEPKEIGLQSVFGAAQRHIVDAVVLEVAKSGGIAFAAGEEVLVDAQDLGADGRMILASAFLQACKKYRWTVAAPMPFRRPRQLRLMPSRCCWKTISWKLSLARWKG